MTGAPLTAVDFTPLMAPLGPFEARPALAVAVSGGRDSLALALLSHDWANERQGSVLALIVDHGLRPEAAGEAASTAALLDRHGIPAEILVWSGVKPRTGLQEEARRARYELLLAECRSRNILHLLTAHHAQDQAETISMRRSRKSGRDGLAGMAAVVERREARLLRPLLNVPRERLTATLQSRGVAWLEDPSNADLRFERARLRRSSVDLAGSDAVTPQERAARDAELARAALDTLEFDPKASLGERAAVDWSAFGRLDGELGARLLGRVVQALGERDYPPRRRRLERAAARMCQEKIEGKSGKGQDFTLASCRLALRQAQKRLRWIVRPESGRNDHNRRRGGQPLVPAAFFACGASRAPHLGSNTLVGTKPL